MALLRAPDLKYIAQAIQLAVDGVHADQGGPFGAVVVRGDTVVGRGCNRVTSTLDPTAHAEVVAIRDACANLGTFDLEGCDLYASCEPCPMCLSAAYWARVDRLYYAACRDVAAAAGFDDARIYAELGLPIENRSLPTQRLHSDETHRPFDVWKEKSDKIRY
jgi:tRNA(Arg) A34 adenosine deaminase TadA